MASLNQRASSSKRIIKPGCTENRFFSSRLPSKSTFEINLGYDFLISAIELWLFAVVEFTRIQGKKESNYQFFSRAYFLKTL